ncbi:MAG: OpgC protein, partial [Hyphomicrobiales bacterium]|nr:OpgC protein [Hyphomicrobiales bacterium]
MLPLMHDSNQSPAVEAIDPKHAAQPRRVAARALNQVDFWRGYALVAIFINHIPGIIFEQFTHRAFGLSDSA